MAIAFDKIIEQWRMRLRASAAGRYFHWWIDELRAVLPDDWQQRLEHARRRLVLSAAEDGVVVSVEENQRFTELATIATHSDAAIRQQLFDMLHERELHEVPRFLLMDGRDMLAKELTLPAAAASNLEQVLSFEMDRHTPFSSREVYFAWRELSDQPSEENIRLQLYVVPRATLDRASETLISLGLAPSGADILEDGKSVGVNLLPLGQRERIVNRKTRLNRMLVAAAIVLLGLTMWLSLALRNHQIGELQDAIAAVRGEALAVQKIREQIDDSSRAASFLTVRRTQSPMAVEVLAEVTRLLPDNTYLDRIVVGNTALQMQGKSTNAQPLIELVNASEMFTSASFRGSTRLDARSGLEIFEINAEVVGGGTEEEGASGG